MVTQLFVTRKEQNGYMMLGISDALAAVAILEKDGFGFLKRRLAGFLGSLAPLVKRASLLAIALVCTGCQSTGTSLDDLGWWRSGGPVTDVLSGELDDDEILPERASREQADVPPQVNHTLQLSGGKTAEAILISQEDATEHVIVTLAAAKVQRRLIPEANLELCLGGVILAKAQYLEGIGGNPPQGPQIGNVRGTHILSAFAGCGLDST